MCEKLSIRPRRVWKRLVIGAICGAGWVCALADTPPEFQDGLKAYTSGDYAGALRYWKPIAEKGDAVAAFNLGVLYARGLGVSSDPVVAAGWYRRAADAGYALAQFNLGAAYMVGAGVGKDHVQAAQWWHKAASQDYAPAIYNLATLHLHGDGVKRDPDRARALYRRAAELGDERARDALASLATARPQPARIEAAHEAVPAAAAVSKTKSPPPAAVAPAKRFTAPEGQTPATAVVAKKGEDEGGAKRDTAFFARQDPKHWTIQLAAFDDPDSAQLFMRTHRITGEGIVVATRAKGQLWYKVLYGVFDERQKGVTAMNALSEHLRKRKPWLRTVSALQNEMVDTPVRKSTASTTANKSAAAPAAPPVPAKSETQPGWRSASKPVTEGVTETPKSEPAPAPASAAPDKPPVAKTTKKSSRKSKDDKNKKIPKAEAQGVAPPPIPADAALKMQVAQSAFNVQDYDKAMGIWRPLAERGIAEAQYGTGFLYESGWGVARDYAKAYEWYRRAAEQGHAKAQFNLGMLYQGGLGVPKNESLALYWIQNAADRNDARAREFLKRSHREVGR